LLVIGVLIVSSAFGLLLAAVQATKVTIDEDLARYWRTTYDILVRPTGSRTTPEEEYGLVQANHLSNLLGGITLNQYEAIKAIPDVEVAAPIAMLGNFNLIFHSPLEISCEEPGFYRLENSVITSDGLRDYETTGAEYFYCVEQNGQFLHLFDSPPYNGIALALTGNFSSEVMPWFKETVYRLPILLAAVDPDEEKKLVSLDEAMVEGEYLHDIGTENIFTSPLDFLSGSGQNDIPIIFNHHIYVDFSFHTRWYRIELPFDEKTLNEIKNEATQDFLAAQSSRLIHEWFFEGQDAYESALNGLRDSTSGIMINSLTKIRLGLAYQNISLPIDLDYPALEVVPYGSRFGENAVLSMPLITSDPQMAFREIEVAWGFGGDLPFLIQGMYDIERISQMDEIVEVPLETYHPPLVVLRYNESLDSVDQITLRPTFNDAGYITSPPLALTTLEHASWIGFNTDAPISAIRIRVAGVDEFTPKAQVKMEAVAGEIIYQTGLDVDITVGSSPRRILVHLPGDYRVPALGYVEEDWVQMGVSYGLSQEIKRVNVLMFLVMFVVSFMYILNTSLISAYGRQKELALQKALGWRNITVFIHVLSEGTLVGVISGSLGLILALILTTLFDLVMPMERAFWILPMGIGLCLFGNLLPAVVAAKTPPIRTLTRQGIIAGSHLRFFSTSILTFSIRQALRRRSRTLIAILTMMISTILVNLILAALMNTQGYITGTLLGEYILMRIGGFHLIIAMISLLISGFSIADVLLISIVERRREIGMLKALGWRNNDLLRLFLGEGATLGLVSGVIGGLIGIIIIHAILDVSLIQVLLIISIGASIPALVGMVTALIPAMFAARISPAEAVRYE
jgi:cell division protein FtsX